MRTSSVSYYRCPVDRSALRPIESIPPGEDIESGTIVSVAGRRYSVVDGVPILLDPETLSDIAAQTKAEYDRVADRIYDDAVDWQFAAFLEDEDKVREGMIDLLGIKGNDCLLEVGCGTGRDSFRLAKRLGPSGKLFMQDLSPNMVRTCRRRMADCAKTMRFECALEYSVSNVSCLPFSDGFFDAAFHFGGLNEFGDLTKCVHELTRVTKLGGRILIGDEAVAPWLRGTQFGAIVSTNNPLFKAELPLHALPVSARDVIVRWLIANCFYIIAFTKGDGPPPLDLDLPHKGWRGGTMRSRYFGQLEGVMPETKALTREAAAAAGVSAHEWIDSILRQAAQKSLKR